MNKALSILAVDNEQSVTVSLRFVFAGPRYEITTVGGADAALARLDSDPFDIIIVDQKMPDVTGLDLVGAIRERGIAGKIIVVSADLSPEIRESFEGLKVDAIFPKPFDVSKLRAEVDRLAA